MSLNLKSESVHQLARELGKLSGESMTAAVENALRERLERFRKTASKPMADRLMEIGRDCAPRLREITGEHGDILYGDDGLPR